MTNERPGTDHVISGPMRGLKKPAFDGANKLTDTQTDGHGDSMTESAQWGRFSEKHHLYKCNILTFCLWPTKQTVGNLARCDDVASCYVIFCQSGQFPPAPVTQSSRSPYWRLGSINCSLSRRLQQGLLYGWSPLQP